ncbi:hypothetical protein BS50DRAFT_572955 [Corynespora cassiicola Philippines]|uniref:RBR-type E3 ubiquitin transferase n=1 Tax=Corynespora cassiicola Philippines TaxID=1448308 RepID=A0A2T2NRA7_CORCC|nr:hypothetical protein BS50DRAFT_572955 [Corynespora cassiicola Philippines]
MGSKISKAVRRQQHVNVNQAATSMPIEPRQPDHIQTKTYQETRPPVANDELLSNNLDSPPTAAFSSPVLDSIQPAITPVLTECTAPGAEMSQTTHISGLAPSSTAQEELAGRPAPDSTESPSVQPPAASRPSSAASNTPPEDQNSSNQQQDNDIKGPVLIECLVCTESMPESELRRPCKSCKHPYCQPCLKSMFIAACEDSERMPPQCCGLIGIYHALDLLTYEEASKFRDKFEEARAVKPFYCPVSQCSAFIPNRFLPKVAKDAKGKRRTDSVVATPTPPAIVDCPKCCVEICFQCRNLTHGDLACGPTNGSLDEETANALQQWGYKRCPKCGHGIRRMYGCDHMACRCGAQFCWKCLQSRDECSGGCDGEESEGYNSEEYEEEDGEVEDNENIDNTTSSEPATASPSEPATTSPSEPATISSSEPTTASPSEPTTAPSSEPTTASPSEPTTASPLEPTTASPSEPTTASPSEPTTASSAPATASPSRNDNLDRRSRHHWDEAGYDFGAEPADGNADLYWNCSHRYEIVSVELSQSIRMQHALECMQCRAPIYPTVDFPAKIITDGITMVPRLTRRGSSSSDQTRPHGRRRLFRGRPTLLRQTASLGSLKSHKRASRSLMAPASTFDPMEDIQYSQVPDPMEGLEFTSAPSKSVMDTYGHVFYEETPALRASNVYKSPLDTIFSPPNPPFSFAHECIDCGDLVCNACKTAGEEIGQEAKEA